MNISFKSIGSALLVITTGLLLSSAFLISTPIETRFIYGTLAASSLGIVLLCFYAQQELTLTDRALRGFFVGLAFSLSALYWLYSLNPIFGPDFTILKIILVTLVILIPALLASLWLIIAGAEYMQNLTAWARALVWSSLWVSFDIFREQALHMPWLLLGSVWHEVPQIAQLASFWGLHGISFFWFLLAALFSMALNADRNKAALASFIGGILFFTLFTYLSSQSATHFSEAKQIRIGILQPALWPTETWGTDDVLTPQDYFTQHTQELIDQDIDLVLWPQGAYPEILPPQRSTGFLEFPMPVLSGAFQQTSAGYYDSAVLFAFGKLLESYQRRLIIPLVDYYPSITAIGLGFHHADINTMLAGNLEQTNLKIYLDDLQAGVLIGPEDRHPQYAVQYAQEGASLFLSVSNDNAFGESTYTTHIKALARFRSYETGLPIVRSSNVGPSFTADIFGHLEEIPAYKNSKEIFIVKLNPNAPTLFVLLYPLGILLYPAILIGALLSPGSSAAIKTKKRHK